MTLPFVSFGNDELSKMPNAHVGMMVLCSICGGQHALEGGTDAGGQSSTLLLFYKCGEKTYLGAVSGKLVISGEAP